MKYSLYLLLFLLLSATQISAQTYSIKGSVKQAGTEITIPNATIILQNLDSVQVDGMISDLDGEFEITNVKNGEYLLKIQYLGYQNLFKSIHVTQDMDLGVLGIKEQATDLDEVTISARRAQGEHKERTRKHS